MEIGGLLGASWLLRALKDLRVAGSCASVGGKHTTGWAVLGSKHKGDLLSFGWGGWESGWKPRTRLLQSWPPAEGHRPPSVPPRLWVRPTEGHLGG